MSSLTVIGEAIVDLIPGPTPRSFVARTGGSPFNVAVGAARLGLPTTLMARIAGDAFGRQLRGDALLAGVDLRHAPLASEPTTVAVVSVDGQAQPAYDFYVEGTADWQWTDAELEATPASTVLHFGSIAAWRAPGAARIAGLIARRRAGGTFVTYDPNVRPGLLGSRAAAVEAIEANVALAHVVKASSEDLAWLYPAEPTAAVADRWLRLGPDAVVVTDGAAGAVGHLADGTTVVRPAVAVDVVDTVGAGDSFMSALIAGVAAAPGGLRTDQLGRAIDRAIAAAAITCGRAGADPPTAAELTVAIPVRSSRPAGR